MLKSFLAKTTPLRNLEIIVSSNQFRVSLSLSVLCFLPDDIVMPGNIVDTLVVNLTEDKEG